MSKIRSRRKAQSAKARMGDSYNFGGINGYDGGYMNPLLRIGVASTAQDGAYRPGYKSFNRMQLEFAYQTSWICGLAVDVVAEDMTREGIDIQEEDPQIIDFLEAAMDNFRVWDSISDAIKWSRLYGGALAVLLIDGDDMSTPLEVDHIQKGRFKGLMVLDRWQVTPSMEDLVKEMGPDFGKPRYYNVTSDAQIVLKGKIHYSRVIRFEGRKLPYYLRSAYQSWGASVLEPIFDRIGYFDMVSKGAAQLVSKSYLRYYKVKGMRQIMTNPVMAEGFLKQMDQVRFFQSTEGMTLGDAEDDFQTFQYSFTGLPEIMLQFGQQISGALGIPLVRLFGQSPVGFNSTGEADMRMYYDNVKHDQDSDLRPGMKRILRALYASVIGRPAPKDLDFEFRTLWQMTNEQKGAAATAFTGAIVQAMEAGAISEVTAMQELKKLSGTIGLFGSITDEDIQAAEEADDLPLPDLDLGGLNGQGEGVDLSGADQNGSPRQVVPPSAPQGEQDGGRNRP